MKKTVKSSKAENRTAKRTSVESTRRAIRSANENEETENKDGFEVDEELIDAVNEETEFGGDNVAKEDVIEAIQAIDAVAASVLEESGENNGEFNADEVIEKIQEVVGADDFELAEEESPAEEGDELPEELNNSVVRVMVQDTDGTITNIESGADDGADDYGSDIYDDSFDGDDATMFDTDELDTGDIELDDESDSDDTELAVVGNSRVASTKYRKGYMKLSSSLKNENKKVWNSAYKAVREMIGSSTEMTSAHWAIVSMIAKDMAKKESIANEKKVATMKRVLNAMAKSDTLKQKLTNTFIKNDGEIDTTVSMPESETKPEETVGQGAGQSQESVDNGGLVNTSDEVGENWGDAPEPKMMLTVVKLNSTNLSTESQKSMFLFTTDSRQSSCSQWVADATKLSALKHVTHQRLQYAQYRTHVSLQKVCLQTSLSRAEQSSTSQTEKQFCSRTQTLQVCWLSTVSSKRVLKRLHTTHL